MKIRKKEYGNCNMVGKNLEKMRKDKGIKPTSYSKLEGQVRIATDKEVYAAAKILGVSTDSLFEQG